MGAAPADGAPHALAYPAGERCLAYPKDLDLSRFRSGVGKAMLVKKKTTDDSGI
ncbi:hypothetical protein PAYE108092_18075 [Paracoccus yeei]